MKIAVAFELNAFSLYVTLNVTRYISSWPEVFEQKLNSLYFTLLGVKNLLNCIKTTQEIQRIKYELLVGAKHS